MHRRELLGAVGLGATGIAGVVGTRATGAQETTTTGTTTAGDGFTGIESESDRPFTTISVGTRAGVSTPESHRPHRVRVWNDSDESRTVGLRLVRDESAVLDRSVEFPADGYLTLRLLEPARYALELRPGGEVGETATTGDAGGAGSGTVEISRARFDCNDSRTDVRVAADGAVQTATTTTNAACPPELTDRTFTAFRGPAGRPTTPASRSPRSRSQSMGRYRYRTPATVRDSPRFRSPRQTPSGWRSPPRNRPRASASSASGPSSIGRPSRSATECPKPSRWSTGAATRPRRWRRSRAARRRRPERVDRAALVRSQSSERVCWRSRS
ncbi:hypothetical protein [Halorussus caseinilyticus]|uniref:Uncharacterized protein n=1 Tax=Halorussus caseinilyticus TaxID=3034025 RepID=A0ABD5WKN1_9EURY